MVLVLSRPLMIQAHNSRFHGLICFTKLLLKYYGTSIAAWRLTDYANAALEHDLRTQKMSGSLAKKTRATIISGELAQRGRFRFNPLLPLFPSGAV